MPRPAPIIPSGRRKLPAAAWLILLSAATFAGPAPAALAQAGPPEQEALIDRPIASVEIRGLQRVPETRLRNLLGTRAGNAFDPRDIARDVETLHRIGEFRTITPKAILQEDGSVVVIFDVVEQPILRDVQVVGNSVISDQELLAAISLTAGVPRDEFLIESSQRRIKGLYRERGHYKAEVLVDEAELEESGILLFRIIEGPRVRIRAIEFEGNEAFSDNELASQVESEEAFFIFRKGRLDEGTIASDIAAVDSYYKDRGYLDVRVDRRLELSPDDTEAKVVFVILEGRIYTVRSITVNGSTVFTAEQLAGLIAIKSGDIYSQDRIRQSLQIAQDSYSRMGYTNAEIRAQEIRTSDAPVVDLRLEVVEGDRHRLGTVEIVGNPLTRDDAIRPELRGLEPGRYIDAVQIEEARRRLVQRRLFNDVTFTLLDPDPDMPEYRDLLVEVKERDTGSFTFGVLAGSDQGVAGEVTLNQRNFDITDWPESFDEWISGRSFRGAGQQFTMRVAPGSEVSEYSISLTEPYLFNRPWALSTNAMFRTREYAEYDEERINGSLRLSRRLGEFWTISAGARVERVELPDIAPFAPVEVFESAGPDVFSGIGLRLTRNTTGTFIRPGRGSVFEVGVEQVVGDFEFTSLSAEYTAFFTVAEDFLGRRSILRLNTRAAYLLGGDDAPVYERFYLGGRTLRGFEFRTVSPKGTRADNGMPSDEPVGGEWLFFAGAQYEFPIFDEVINGVVFVDSGTVIDSIGFEDYRVSVGVGIRLYIDALGPVPIALDLGFPIRKGPGDESQIFSFSAEFPF